MVSLCSRMKPLKIGCNMKDFDLIWQELQTQMDLYESNFDEITKQKYGIYWTNLELSYQIVNKLFDTFDEYFLENLTQKKILEPCVGMGSFIFSFLRKIYEDGYSKDKVEDLIKNIYFCDIDENILKLFTICYKKFVKDLFGIDLSDNIIDSNSCQGLIFNKFSSDYLSIEDAFKKNITFDIIITNPPYKGLKIDSKSYSDLDKYESDKKFYNELSKKLTKNFTLANQGVPNLYKFFVEKIILEYANHGAYISLLIPNTFLADKTTLNLRKYIIENTEINKIDLFEENSVIFSGVTQSLTNIYLKKEKKESYSIEFNDKNSKKEISIDLVRNLDENFSLIGYDSKDVEILTKLSFFPKVKSLPFVKNQRGELDLTLFKSFISSDETSLKLVKGNDIQKYKLKEKLNPSYVFSNFIEKSKKSIFIKNKRIACPQISNQKSEIRIKFSLIEEGHVLGNSCNFISVEENLFGYDIYYFLALFNTSIINWFFKKFNSNNHIGNYEIANFPIHNDKLLIEEISSLCKDYLNTLDSKILDDINRLVLDGFNLLDGKVDISSEKPDKLNPNDLDEKKFFKKVISNDLSNFENNSLLATKYKLILEDHNLVMNSVGFKLSELDLEMISQVPPGGNWKNISETTMQKSQRLMQIAKSGGRTTLYGRMDYDKPAYTVTTYFNRPGNGTYVHPKFERVITAREAARLQSFPDNYYFYGNKKDILTQIGNAVPCLFAKALGLHLKKMLPDLKTFGDLFAGAGGMSHGMFKAGLKPIFANDFFLSACITHKANHPDTDVIYGDILEESTKQKIYHYANKVDILCGGPPCQGFSHAGKRIIDDPRNQLFLEFIRSISVLKPKVVVMENVQGFLTLDKGNFYLQTKELLNNLGYVCEGRLLNTAHYGVPQKRKRVIILGVHKDFIAPHKIEDFFPIPSTKDESQQVTAFEAISDLEKVIPDVLCKKPSDQNDYLYQINQ